MKHASSRYDGEDGSRYFAWQSGIGQAGAILNRDKFIDHVSADLCVVDFGCGGGDLLAALPAARRLGIEPNPAAREAAARRGLEVFSSTRDVPDGIADVVISNHALEHTLSPYDELVGLRRILRSDGSLVLWLPLDDWRTQRYATDPDINGHLYTWTPLILGNILEDAGYAVRECQVITTAWHPSFVRFKTRLPDGLYRSLTWALAVAKRRRQLRAVAQPRLGD